MRRKGKQIGIVGGGATGVLVALQLLRHPRRIARVVMIERNVPPALGVAYRTMSDSHLLNSRADRMDALDEIRQGNAGNGVAERRCRRGSC